MKTPYFLIKKAQLNDNVDSFHKALKKYWKNSLIAYSIKTNSLPWLLKYLKTKDVIMEAVSDEEYRLAELAGFEADNIVFNGPIKSYEYIKNAVEKNSFINIDSEADVAALLKIGSFNSERIGIRINIKTSIFDENDVSYVEDGFRFGFSEENGELLNVIDRLGLKNKPFGLHLHCNSVTRNTSVYKAISRYAAQLIAKHGWQISYIDIGGGFAGGIKGKPTAEEYVLAIKNELSSVIDVEKTTLLIEPGSAIIGSVVELHTSVVDVKDTIYSRIVTTDGSRIYLDPLWKKQRYAYRIKKNGKSSQRVEKQIICGYTCMDHDRIMTLQGEQELEVGDKIIYMHEGAYSMTLGGMFIRYLSDVYVEDDDKVYKVRRGLNAEEYFKIQSI